MNEQLAKMQKNQIISLHESEQEKPTSDTFAQLPPIRHLCSSEYYHYIITCDNQVFEYNHQNEEIEIRHVKFPVHEKILLVHVSYRYMLFATGL